MRGTVATADIALIGVGASAGGLEALCRFFEGLPVPERAAFVVAQHLSPHHPSIMPELIARRTELTVVAARNHARVESGHIYVLGPGDAITVTDGRLVTSELVRDHTTGVVDRLFSSLLHAGHDRVACVVLSGSGRDGAEGAAKIAEAEHPVFVQEPRSAGFASMPEAALDAVHAAIALPPSTLATAVDAWLHEDSDAGRLLHSLPELIDHIRQETSVNLWEYKVATIERRLRTRMDELGHSDPTVYAKLVMAQRHEVHELLRRMFISVSSFFRDEAVFNTIQDSVIPALDDRRTIRMWSAGCAYGQEAYSLAMLFAEADRRHGRQREIRVLATDVSETALERARAGYFSAAELEGVPSELLERYFEAMGDGWCVTDTLRRCVVIAPHNLQHDTPFTKLDLVTCRNTLIYFRSPLQRRLARNFAFAVQPGGFLVLGEGEQLANEDVGFLEEDWGRGHIYRRNNVPVRPALMQAVDVKSTRPRRPKAQDPTQLARDVLSQRYMPPALVVEPDGGLAFVLGAAEPFLTMTGGRVTTRVDRLLRRPLGTLIISAINDLREGKREVWYPEVPLTGGAVAQVSLRVTALSDQAQFLAVLEPCESALTSDDEVSHPDRELEVARGRLQKAVAEMNRANEDLRALNEELHASNEELQATNEELHASNEELHTLGVERLGQIDELTQVNADIHHVLEAAHVGTLFLDHNLRVRRIAGPLRRFVRVEPRDLGRRLSDLRTEFEADVDYEAVCRRVIDRDQLETLHLSLVDGSPVTVTVRPYHREGSVQGTVVTFVDASEMKLAESKLQAIADALPQNIALLDASGRIAMVNRAWREFSQTEGGDPERTGAGASYFSATKAAVDEGEEVAVEVQEALDDLVAGRAERVDLSYTCDSPTEQRDFVLQARRLPGHFGVLVSHLNISDVYRDTLRALIAVLEDSPKPIILVRRDDTIELANHAARALLGPTAARDQMLSPLITFEESDDDTLACSLHLPDGSVSGAIARVHPLAGHRAVCLDIPPSLDNHFSQRLAQFASNMAHEMNNVLAAVMSTAQLRLLDTDLSPPIRREMDDIVAACRRGRDTTRNLLGFARPTNARRTTVVVADVVNELIEPFRATLPAGVQLEHDCTDASIKANRSLFGQALLNLLVNARDAVAMEGTIRITSHETEKSVVIEVTDDGAGMSSTTQARAAEPFFSTKGERGTGLGLALVERFVSQAGGAWQVHSEVGSGTRITLRFPAARLHRVTTTPLVELPLFEGTVWVIDDDPMVCKALARSLEQLGFQAMRFEEGEHALKTAVDQAAPDLVLIDYSMPNIDGITLHAKLRRLWPDVKAVMVSGHELHPPSDSATPWMRKPFEPAELVSVLEGLGLAGQDR